MENVYCDTLILSDLHLGAEASRARDAFHMLKGQRFRRLILLGDIFCDLNFGRLKKDHWRFLSYIRKLSNPKRGVEVVWVEGNHDHGLADVMSHLVGVRVYQEYMWTFRGIRHLAIHGHQFDRFIINNLKLCQVGTSAFLQLQKLDSKHNRITRWIDRMNTRWMRMSAKVASGAFAHALARGTERVFCGHTHQPMCVEHDGIEYYNAGSWLAGTATYVTICEKGVQIHDYDTGADHRNSGEERGDAAAEIIEFSREAALLEDADYESVPG